MVGKNHTAQALTLRLLQMLHLFERKGVYMQARKRLSGNMEAMKQLELCVMMSGELDSEPQKYKDIEKLGKAIIARQTGRNSNTITKKEVGKAAGFKECSVNNILDRIHDHVRELKPEEIFKLCSGFKEESNRLFWENQIYLLFPELRVPDTTNGPILDCLQAVWDSLTKDEQETASTTFLSYADWFQKLKNETENNTSSEDTGLYEFLENARKRSGVKQTRIFDELNMDSDTYYSYKKRWEAFEKEGCKGAYPKKRLIPREIIILGRFS